MRKRGEDLPTKTIMSEDKTNYLKVEFDNTSPHERSLLESPILISDLLIDKIREKRKILNSEFGSYADYNAKLFRKENIVSTLKYILEHVDHDLTRNSGWWTIHFSKLPPQSETMIYVNPKDLSNIPWKGTLQEKNKDGKITFATDNIAFSVIRKFNEMDALGVTSPSTLESMFHAGFDFHETKTAKYTSCGGSKYDRIVTDLNKLNLTNHPWEDPLLEWIKRTETGLNHL